MYKFHQTTYPSTQVHITYNNFASSYKNFCMHAYLFKVQIERKLTTYEEGKSLTLD